MDSVLAVEDSEHSEGLPVLVLADRHPVVVVLVVQTSSERVAMVQMGLRPLPSAWLDLPQQGMVLVVAVDLPPQVRQTPWLVVLVELVVQHS